MSIPCVKGQAVFVKYTGYEKQLHIKEGIKLLNIDAHSLISFSSKNSHSEDKTLANLNAT